MKLLLLICSSSLLLLHIDSDGIDLPGDFMTMISTHRGLYSVVQEISEFEGVIILVGKSGS